MSDSEVEFLLAQAERALDAQWESADRLANRASTLIGVGISILTGVIIVTATQHAPVPNWITVATSGLVLGSAVSASLAYFVTGADYPPNPTGLIQVATARDHQDTRWKLLTTVARAHEEDGKLTSTRQSFVNVSIGLFVAAIFMIIGGVAAYLL